MGLPTLNPPPLTTPFADRGGIPVATWGRWLHLLQQIVTDVLHPTTPAGLSQTGAVYQGSGVPSNSEGNNGDVYFRTDAPATANQRIYIKAAGAWTGIV